MSAYATQTDIENRYGAEALLVAADRDGDGEVDENVVEKALDDATDEINAYIGTRFSLPLATVPALLVRLCVDIAFYRLSADAGSATEEKRKRFDDVLVLLNRISKGDAGLDVTPATKTVNGSATISGPARRFTRGSQGGIR